MDSHRNDYREDRGFRGSSDDFPMYSRLFVICDRKLKDKQLRDAFSKFGQVDDMKIPLDHKSGEPKGIAFIKYAKTSEAALALEGLNGKSLDGTKPLRVMVANNRCNIQCNEIDTEKYRRLFINITKDMTEHDIAKYFKQYGSVEDVLVQKDRNTGAPKGFAYVKFRLFSEAACASEQCDRRYRAIFAAPRVSKRPETSFESRINSLAGNSLITMMNVQPQGFNKLHFMCSPFLSERHVARLFNLIPGMTTFKLVFDLVRNFSKGFVEYANPICAQYALEELNEFEYPPGQRIFVKPGGHKFCDREENSYNIPYTVNKLNNAISEAHKSETPDLAKLTEAVAQASKIIKKVTAGVSDDSICNPEDLNYCSAQLPPQQPLSHIDSSVAKRLFLICKPQPPPLTVLRDIFCRFGNLISVYTLPNKTVGYACYSTAESADMAMTTLHGAEVCGVRMKVIIADEEVPSKRMRFE